LISLVGIIAGALTTFSFIPQIMRVFKSKSAQDISLVFNTMFLAGILLWLTYGILKKDVPIIAWNATASVLSCTLLYAKLKYGRQEVSK
jgi:MtN3 and saliva related transmembrane protein